jgi:ABC-type nitrate/sulfonate/bicarbonate transport system substrate-binding protein
VGHHQRRCFSMFIKFLHLSIVVVSCLSLAARLAYGQETVTVALTSKAFQYTILPVAQERGYMKEEGIDLKIVYMQNAPGLQALSAGSVQFSGSGSSALVAISKGGAPFKTVIAANDQVLQWVVAPNISSIKDLKDKEVGTTGVASIAAYMFRNIMNKYGMDGNKDVVFVDPGPVNRLPSLLSGAVDAAILSPEERYAAIDQGMKDLMFIGKEVRNSWGTIATSDRFIKEQPKVMAGFARAVVKALRYVRQNREGAIAAAIRFTELDNVLVIRMYDDIAKTFTVNGIVDEEAQRNDLAIVREIAGVTEVVPIGRAYDFSFARQADQQLTKAGWKP